MHDEYYNDNDPDADNESLALISDHSSDFLSSLSQSKEIIIENPNGTYCHAVLAKKQMEDELMQQRGQAAYPRNRILYIVDDDEIALYSGFYELPTDVDEFLKLFQRHQRYFACFLVLILITETMFEIFAFQDKDRGILVLMTAYKTREIETLEKIYMASIISQIVYMVVYYILGFAAVYKRSVKLYSWFATVSLVGLIMELFFAYTNRFDISIFLLRFVGFVYSRFVNQLLVSLLLLPR